MEKPKIEKKDDYSPSPEEYWKELVTLDVAAIRDILQKIERGVYEADFPKNTNGELLEEKVTDKTGKMVFYNDVQKTREIFLAPHIKQRNV